MLNRIVTSREALLMAAIIVLLGLVATRFPSFVEPSNLLAVFNDTSPLILLAIGQMIVILTKCIDLSVAANLALTGMVVAMINVVAPDIPVPVILAVAICLGTLMGMFNGFLVWKLDIPPIVVTLGTMTIFRGIIFLISDGKWVNSHEMSETFKAFPRTEILGLPVMGWTAIFAIVLFSLVMTRTTIGRAFYAVGGNPHAATYAGIDVGKSKFWAFTISGALARVDRLSVDFALCRCLCRYRWRVRIGRRGSLRHWWYFNCGRYRVGRRRCSWGALPWCR